MIDIELSTVYLSPQNLKTTQSNPTAVLVCQEQNPDSKRFGELSKVRELGNYKQEYTLVSALSVKP